MEKTSQLLLRNTEQLGDGAILLINPGRDSFFRDISPRQGSVHIFTQDYGDYCWFRDSDADVEFGLIPAPGDNYQTIILSQPREKARLEMMLHACLAKLNKGGELWLPGENHSGIKSCGKRMQKYFSRVVKIDSARHCTLFCASLALPLPPFNLDDYQEHWQVEGFNESLSMVSLPGSFAHGRLDKGTRELLDVLDDMDPTGSVLDFGCGSGVIGLALLKRNPAIKLTLLDTSAIALESARLSIQANLPDAAVENSPGVTVLPSDGLSALSEPCDWIISNPPFHRGVGTDLTIAQRFFADSTRVLAKKGKMLLVSNRHLPYEAWLEANYASVSCTYSGREFKILLARRPRV